MIKFDVQKKKLTGQTITPGVIEPSFGLGRIIYSVLEHSFWVREAVCSLSDLFNTFRLRRRMPMTINWRELYFP